MSEKKLNKKAAPKKKPVAKVVEKPKMYIGPTIAGVAIKNTVYSEKPEGLKEAEKLHPELTTLFIDVEDYSLFNKMNLQKKGYLYDAYQKALFIK